MKNIHTGTMNIHDMTHTLISVNEYDERLDVCLNSSGAGIANKISFTQRYSSGEGGGINRQPGGYEI